MSVLFVIFVEKKMNMKTIFLTACLFMGFAYGQSRRDAKIIENLELLRVYAKSIPSDEKRMQALKLIDENLLLLDANTENANNQTATVNKPSEKTFETLLDGVKNKPFDNSKLELIQGTLSKASISCEQLSKLLVSFSFDKEKINLVKWAYPKLIDPVNIAIVIDQFTFEGSKREVLQWIKAQ